MKSFVKLTALTQALVLGASMLAVAPALASGTSYNAPAKAKTAKATKLKLNLVQIQLIQNALKDLGHNPGLIDGKWGSSSSAALRLYQVSVGSSQTGALDVNTSCRLLQIGIANHGSSSKMPGWCGFN